MSFSFVDMWHAMGPLAKAVVIILAIMSVYSLGVMAERLWTYFQARKQNVACLLALRDQIGSRKISEAMTSAKAHKKSPLAKVMGAGLAEYARGLEALRQKGPDEVGDFDLVDAVNRSLERVKDREVADLRRGLGGLASIGSTAPFVGLFGTVVGIINAFRGMAQTGSGGLGAVSAGIAEALVTTAFGLLVAIPAVMMFNYFTGRVEGFVVDINEVSSEFVDIILKEGR
jgi:biopolymer transport protein ExbB